MNTTDRYYIERKYHDPEKSYDPFRRMAYHGIGYIEESGLSEEELLEGLRKLEGEIEELPHPVARAMAIRYVLENERIYVNAHDYFVGLDSLNRLANSVTFSKWAKESMALRKKELVEKTADFNEAGAVAIWVDYDHVVPDWSALMELGFAGIRKRAEMYRQKHEKEGTLTEEMAAFFQGIDIQYGAILDLLDRICKIAEKETFEKAPKIAACIKQLRDGNPTDFYEALQMIYLYFIISESIDSYQVRSLGNGLDQTLYSFYKQDLESGKYTREEMGTFLEYFLLQWAAIDNYWGQPFYMGGTDIHGNTRYNELSKLILDVYDDLEIYNPKIQMKINRNTPDAILQKAFQMVKRKNASIVFCCEPAMMKAMMAYGATYEEAHDYDIRGCYELGVRGNEASSCAGYVNAAKAVEYVFTNGFDWKLNKQVGVKTGELEEIKSFDDFYNAFLKQWGYLIRECIIITNDAEKYLAYVNPSSMYSATVETALKNGKDGYSEGVKFNNNDLLNCSFASAVDSLMGVKEFVFEKQAISLQELASALQQNWQGYEKMRLKIKKSPRKYGNHDAQTDQLAKEMAFYFADTAQNMRNNKGGRYKAEIHSARQFVEQGKKTGALPDGSLAGEELSKNASPVPGMDRNGVTALVESAVNLTPSDYHCGFCLDVMMHPSAIAGENGYGVFKSVLMTYLQKGGQSIQFNVFSTETLRDAQKNPEKYKNLQVRVCGWNVLWCNLDRTEQDAYILRAENMH